MNKIFKGLLVAVMFTSMCACSSDETSQSSQVETSELSLSFFDASVERALTRLERMMMLLRR